MGDVVWVDEHDNERGVITRKKAHDEKLLHRLSAVFVVREDGKLLIQERLSGRFDYSAAGHVDPGETYLQAAQRELREELGMSGELTYIGTINSTFPPGDTEDAGHITALYICSEGPVHINKEEVRGVFWSDPKNIYMQMQEDRTFKKFTKGFNAGLAYYLKSKKLL